MFTFKSLSLSFTGQVVVFLAERSFALDTPINQSSPMALSMSLQLLTGRLKAAGVGNT